MNISTYSRHHPVGFVLTLTILWVVMLLIFMGIASTVFHKPYSDAMTVSIGRLAVTACVLLLAWRLDWLKASGIFSLGSWRIWLLALEGLGLYGGASLYSFYGSIAFDLSSLLRLPDARTAVTTHFVAGLSEEILFRGLLFYALIRVFGEIQPGNPWERSPLLCSLCAGAYHPGFYLKVIADLRPMHLVLPDICDLDMVGSAGGYGGQYLAGNAAPFCCQCGRGCTGLDNADG